MNGRLADTVPPGLVTGPSRGRGSLRLLAALTLVGAAACGGGNAKLEVLPPEATVRPGESVTFSVPDVAAADVRWSLAAPCAGAIAEDGRFTAASEPVGDGTCRVVARYARSARSPLLTGSAVVTVLFGAPTYGAVASGGRQVGGAFEVQSVALEPIAGPVAQDLSTGTENRAGFHPSATTSP